MGQDKADILSIKKPGKNDIGLTLASRGKTAKKRNTYRERFFPYFDKNGNDTGLQSAASQVLALPRKVGSFYLFSTRKGQPYIKKNRTTSGFDSIWQRAMIKALKETPLEIRFTEHDLRAKIGSDLETDEQAQRQLDHASKKQREIHIGEKP